MARDGPKARGSILKGANFRGPFSPKEGGLQGEKKRGGAGEGEAEGPRGRGSRLGAEVDIQCTIYILRPLQRIFGKYIFGGLLL